MYEINKYVYVDVNTKSKFEVYARKDDLVEELVKRINALGTFLLRKRRFRYCVKMVTEREPYLVEQEQIETVENWEINARTQNIK